MHIPSAARLGIWIMMLILVIFMLVVEAPQVQQREEPVVILPIQTTASRAGTKSELQMSIEELGKQKLAKRIYFIDSDNKFQGTLVWWHDGRHECLSYLAAVDENWTEASIGLLRGLMMNKIHVMNFEGDDNVGLRLSDFAKPFDCLLPDWTILLRQ